MGCIVNGPGESKHANIGISLPGTFEEPKAPVYIDGKLAMTLKGDHIVEEFQVILDEYVQRTYGGKQATGGYGKPKLPQPGPVTPQHRPRRCRSRRRVETRR